VGTGNHDCTEAASQAYQLLRVGLAALDVDQAVANVLEVDKQGNFVGHRDTPHSGVTQETHTDVPSNTRTSWRAEESSKLSDFDAVMSTGKSTSRHREKSKTDCALNMPEYMHYTTRGNIAHGTVPCTGTPSTTVPNGSRRFTPARLRLED